MGPGSVSRLGEPATGYRLPVRVLSASTGGGQKNKSAMRTRSFIGFGWYGDVTTAAV